MGDGFVKPGFVSPRDHEIPSQSSVLEIPPQSSVLEIPP
jgi:hypothetical protein